VPKEASQQPVVMRRRHVKRQRRCNEMGHNNQPMRTKRGDQGWTHEVAGQ